MISRWINSYKVTFKIGFIRYNKNGKLLAKFNWLHSFQITCFSRKSSVVWIFKVFLKMFLVFLLISWKSCGQKYSQFVLTKNISWGNSIRSFKLSAAFLSNSKHQQRRLVKNDIYEFWDSDSPTSLMPLWLM